MNLVKHAKSNALIEWSIRFTNQNVINGHFFKKCVDIAITNLLLILHTLLKHFTFYNVLANRGLLQTLLKLIMQRENGKKANFTKDSN